MCDFDNAMESAILLDSKGYLEDLRKQLSVRRHMLIIAVKKSQDESLKKALVSLTSTIAHIEKSIAGESKDEKFRI